MSPISYGVSYFPLAHLATINCRLNLTPPASIQQDSENSGIIVSEAHWPNSSAQEFEAYAHCYATPPASTSADEGFLPAPPYEDPIEVQISKFVKASIELQTAFVLVLQPCVTLHMQLDPLTTSQHRCQGCSH